MERRALVIVFLLLLLVSRAALVLVLADVFFYGEELAKGASAKAILDRIPLEYWKLTYVPHEGGGFVVAHLQALLFRLVGGNVLANKLAALLTTALVLAAGLSFVRAAFGRRAAMIFGVLFVLAPAAFVRFSLLSIGAHFEALLFLVLAVHYTLRVADAEPARVRDVVLLGLAAGVGLYFSLQTAPAIAASAVYLACFARRSLTLQRAGLAALGGLAGLAPMLYMAAHAGMAVLQIRGQSIGAAHGTSARDAFRGFLEALASQGDVFTWIAVLAYPLVIVLGLALPGERSEVAHWRRHALLPALVVVFLLGAYVTSGLAIEGTGQWTFFWRLSTPWLFATVLFAAAAASLSAHPSGVPRIVAGVATAALVVAGIDDHAALVRTGTSAALGENVRQLVSFKGYDYIVYFDKLKTRLAGDAAARIAPLLHFHDDPAYLLPSIEHSLFDRSPLPIGEVLALARASYGERWLESLKGLGPYLAAGGRYDVARAFARLGDVPEEVRAPLAEAIGRTGRGLRPTRDLIDREIAGENVLESWRADFWRGTGWRLFQLHRLRPEEALARIARAEEPARSALRAGFDAAHRARSLTPAPAS